MDFKRVAGWAGLTAVLLFVLSLVFAGSTPAPEDGVAEIGEYLASNQAAHNAGLLFGAVAVIPLVMFLAGFLVPFMRSDREHGEAFSIVIFGGLLLLGAGAAVGQSALGVLLLRGGSGLDAPTARALWDLQSMGYGGGVIAITIFAGGVAMAVFRRAVMSAWVGQLSAFVAVLGPLGLFTLLSDTNAALLGYLPFLGFLIWLLAISVNMVRSSAAAA
jgi:hypothetical protein